MSAPDRPGGRQAFAVWTVALLVYVLAVFHRSSLAVAGLAASERFGISASQLAAFTMLQLLVYAGMQVPVGLLVDRFGPRSVLATGAITLTCAQVGFALVDTYPLALAARFFVGIGDAMTFICVLRLVSAWFAPRRIPFMVQVTGVLGQLGALFAAVPMTWALSQLGWSGAYLVAAGIGIVLTVALVLVVRDGPGVRNSRGQALQLGTIRASLSASWSHPGTRLGFWMHFTTQFPSTVLGLLWGFPFLVKGEGRTEAEAGLLLTLMVVAIMIAGPLMGWRIGLRPWQRSTLVIWIILAIIAVWTLVLAWPSEAPLWLLALLVVTTGLGGPAAVIGFDLARTSNPPDRLASATGIVNMAGFMASLVLVLAIGVVLDRQTPGTSTDYTPDAFRSAMSCQYLLWGVGLVQIVRYRRKARARLRADDPALWAAMSAKPGRPDPGGRST